MFCIVFVLFIPICYLKEIDPNEFPTHTPSGKDRYLSSSPLHDAYCLTSARPLSPLATSTKEFFDKLWLILQNLTTFYMLVYVIGVSIFTATINNAGVYLQYYILELTNFQAGVDTITTYLALVAGVWIFQRYLLNENWRTTKYASIVFTAILGLMWPLAFHNSGGLMNPWFTIFVDLDQSFAQGITQVRQQFSNTIIAEMHIS